MDLRTLNCFIVLAEQLHFRRAADSLYMTQPALTARIQGLEKEIGVRLFDRDRRSVSLTASGVAFMAYAKATLQSGTEAIAQARRAAGGEVGRLRFGFSGLTSYCGMPEIVQQFKRLHPEVEIELIHTQTSALEAALLRDEVDIALLHPPISSDAIELKEIAWDPLVLALPSSHELARLSAVPLRRLAGEPLLMSPRSAGPHLYDQIVRACANAGFTPYVAQEIPFMTTMVGFVAAGIGCGFVLRALNVIQRPGVVYRPLAETEELRIATALAWRKGALSAVAQRLLALV
jgi:DNA-binding transcriptional LysR family regulator